MLSGGGGEAERERRSGVMIDVEASSTLMVGMANMSTVGCSFMLGGLLRKFSIGESDMFESMLMWVEGHLRIWRKRSSVWQPWGA